MIYYCFLSMLAVAIISLFARYFTWKLASDVRYINYMDEFLGNVCSGVIIMQLAVVGSMYGCMCIPTAGAVFIHLYLGNVGLYSNPLAFITSFYANQRKVVTFSAVDVFMVIFMQITGLLIGQYLSMFLWTYADQSSIDAVKVAGTSVMSMSVFKSCMFYHVNVISHSWKYCAFIECFGTFTCLAIDFVTPRKMKAFVGALVPLAVILLLGHISGTFMNPSIATAFAFGCDGDRKIWHSVVMYWLAPALGTVLAWEMWLGINGFMQKRDVKAGKED